MPNVRAGVPGAGRKPVDQTRSAEGEERWTGCIEFDGYISQRGYGQRKYQGKVMHAHRAAWIEEHGPITAGWHVHHCCHNARCVNVAHLEVLPPGQHSSLHAAEGATPLYTIDEATGCWNWQRWVEPSGYGRHYDCLPSRRSKYAHRWMWEQHNGPLGRRHLHNLCGRLSCVNPEHWSEATQKGAKLTPDDARAIRQSPYGAKRLAKQFGVSRGLVERIKAGVAWRGV